MGKIKTAWVSGFVSYEQGLIDKLGKRGFNINVFEDSGIAVKELEKSKYELIVVGSELGIGLNIDDDFKQALQSCKNEGVGYEYDCSKISMYFIDRIKKGRKSEINKNTPFVVDDYFCKFPKNAEKERFIIAGANSIITSMMCLDEIVNKLKYF